MRPLRVRRQVRPRAKHGANALVVVQDVQVVTSGVPSKEGLPDVTVSEVIRRQVATVHPDSPITQVIELLLTKDFTSVPVVDSD